MDIVIVTNSPGEIKGWVTPVVEEIAKHAGYSAQSDRILIFIPHCQYASGREKEIASSIPGVSRVFGPPEHLSFVLFNRGIKGGFSKNGVVVHLGSDFFHSLLISRRLHYPAIAYTHDAQGFYGRRFARFLVPDRASYDRLAAKGVRKEKIGIAGDLFVDAVKPLYSRENARKKWNIGPQEMLAGIFPGSRPYQTRYMTSFFLKCCKLLSADLPGLKFILSRAPFVSDGQIHRDVERAGGEGVLESVDAVLRNGVISVDGGPDITVITGMPYDVMNACDLILTIPGTNTAQIAAAGCPMVVVVPMNKPEEIPLDGIAGYLQYLPFGRHIKRHFVLKFDRSVKYAAIPNSKAGRDIVPELRGSVNSGSVKEKALALLKDGEKRNIISQELRAVMGKGGAAGMIAGEAVSIAKGI